MKLIRRRTLFYQAGTSDKVYEVDLCTLGEDRYLVNFRYGRRGKTLKEGTKTTEAVNLKQAEQIFARLIASKLKEGYWEAPAASPAQIPRDTSQEPRHQAILERLKTRNGEKWPLERVIWRAGELQIRAATPLLIPLIGTGNYLRDYCIAASLGRCGDETAIPHLRKLYDKKSTPEFVKRITWEAILKLTDEQEKENLRQQQINELPPQLQNLAKNGTPQALEEEVNAYINQPISPDPAVQEFQIWLSRINWWNWQRNEETRRIINQRIEQLPPQWRAAISPVPTPQPGKYVYWSPYNLQQEVNNYNNNEKSKLYRLIDTLYQIDNINTRSVILKIVQTAPLSDQYWFQRLRHIFKMAEYRGDAEIFTILAYRFEKTKSTYYRPYGRKTREYLRRRIWRTLKELGSENSPDYVKFVVPLLLKYSDEDAQPPKQSVYYRWTSAGRSARFTCDWDTYGGYVIFNHILYENSPRYVFHHNTSAWRCRPEYKPGAPPPEDREEAFPQLWEQHPEALLRLLLESRCHPVHQFAAKALHACKSFCETLELSTLLQLLSQPYQETVTLAFHCVKQKYNPNQPNRELLEKLVNCNSDEARVQAHQWIQQAQQILSKDSLFLLNLVRSKYQDTRDFARQFLQGITLSEPIARELIARIISHLLTVDNSQTEIATDIGDTLIAVFSSQLRSLSFEVIQDLLSHSLPEVQGLGARILLNHEIPAVEFPQNLIESLIESQHESVRSLGVQLFGKLPQERLLKEYDLLLAMAASSVADIRQSVRPIIQKLARNNPNFASQLATEILDLLIIPEKREGIHADLILLLREDLPGWMLNISRENTTNLLNCQSSVVQELGGLILQEKSSQWLNEFTIAQIVKLASHDILIVRETARRMFEERLPRIRSNTQELLSAVRLLESKWEDTRQFAQNIFNQFSAQEWTPEVMTYICDSVKDDVRAFGRNLVITYFHPDYGYDYLLKFSEHPSIDMQLFATNYLENYGVDNCHRLKKLKPYFITVLSQVNRGRVAKDRIFAFLEQESLKSQQAAQIVTEILQRQSLTIALGDKAKNIEIMLKIKQKYPDMPLPISIKKTEEIRR